VNTLDVKIGVDINKLCFSYVENDNTDEKIFSFMIEDILSDIRLYSLSTEIDAKLKSIEVIDNDFEIDCDDKDK